MPQMVIPLIPKSWHAKIQVYWHLYFVLKGAWLDCRQVVEEAESRLEVAVAAHLEATVEGCRPAEELALTLSLLGARVEEAPLVLEPELAQQQQQSAEMVPRVGGGGCCCWYRYCYELAGCHAAAYVSQPVWLIRGAASCCCSCCC